MLAFALQAVAAFNLVCTGTYTSGEIMRQPEESRQVQVIFRVDLDSGRWCSGSCETTAAIHSFSDTRILFRVAEDREAHSDDVTTVSRENGEYLDRERFFIGSQYRYRMTMGTCQRAPFGGFPQRRF